MQEGTSAEKIKILKAYGAEVELTPKNEGFGRAGGRAKEMEEEEDNTLPEVSSKRRYRYRMFILQME